MMPDTLTIKMEKAMHVSEMTRRAFLMRTAATGAATSIFAGAGARVSSAAPAVSLRISTGLPNDPVFSVGRMWFDAFNERITANAKGDIALQFFPNNQLGQEADVVDQIKLGVTDIMLSAPSIWANVIPQLGLLDLGFIFQSFEQQTVALKGLPSERLEKLLADRGQARILAWCYNGGSRNYLTKAPFTDPAGLRGKKVRVAPNPTALETCRLMGAAGAPMAWGETYTAIQTGVLDGVEHDSPTLLAGKMYENAKFLTLTQHIMSPFCVFASQQTLNKIPANLREGFYDAVAYASATSRTQSRGSEALAIAQLKSSGVTVGECDRKAFQERVRPSWDAFTTQRPETKEILDAILKAQA